MKTYTYHFAENKIVCITKYAGKAVRGIAKCDERFDEFNTDTGKKLSKARCDVNVRKKMVARSAEKVARVEAELANLTRIAANLKKKYNEDLEAYVAAKDFLKDLENSLE